MGETCSNSALSLAGGVVRSLGTLPSAEFCPRFPAPTHTSPLSGPETPCAAVRAPA